MSELEMKTYGEFSVYLEEGWYAISEIEKLLTDLKVANARQSKAIAQMMKPVGKNK